MLTEKWLTTLDNPFDYWSQHDDWKRFDEDHGYRTSERIARLALTSPYMSLPDEIEAINEAVEEIAKWNPTGNYRITSRTVSDDFYEKDDDDKNES